MTEEVLYEETDGIAIIAIKRVDGVNAYFQAVFRYRLRFIESRIL